MTRPYNIGVMQGRLLPKYEGRYQAHPVGRWQEEFALAAELGLDTIEFILDFNDAENNPLLNASGIEKIAQISEGTGVAVKSICADYFMEAPLHSGETLSDRHSREVLQRLIVNVPKIGATDIVIPCVDQSSLDSDRTVSLFTENIRPAIELAEHHRVNLSLETDLPPGPFSDLLARLDSTCVTVNYDTGNSAALGYDPAEELAAYGHRITDIHIKDRTKGGGSVVLGSGDTNFEKFFSALTKTDYRGLFILQAYRDDEGINIFKEQLKWIRPRIENWAAVKGVT